jgi:hypothetical protein
MTRTDLADITLSCSTCGEVFVFSAHEQQFQLARGIRMTPDHCPPCVRRVLQGRIVLHPAIH